MNANIPKTLRFEIRRHVIEFIHVEETRYRAELDGARKKILVREEVSEEHCEKKVADTEGDVVDLSRLICLLRSDSATTSTNSMWFEINDSSDTTISGWQYRDQFVVWIADDGSIAIAFRYESWMTYYH